MTFLPFAVRWLVPGDEALATRAMREVLEDDPRGIEAGWLADPRQHLAVALVDGVPAGVAYGHTLPLPDGRTEMLLYSPRRRGGPSAAWGRARPRRGVCGAGAHPRI